MPNLSPIGMISFPHLFTPKAPAQGAEPRFSINLIFDKAAQADPAFKELKKQVMAAAEEEWPGKAADMFKTGKLRSPFRDCKTKEDFAGYDVDGGVFIQAWTKTKPGIVNGRLQEITVPGDIWAGQLGRIDYKAFGYDNSGNKGVSLLLNNVQITKMDMPRLDGRASADKAFTAVDDPSASSNGASPDDDDIPF